MIVYLESGQAQRQIPIAFLRRPKILHDRIVEKETCRESIGSSKTRRLGHGCCYKSRTIDMSEVNEATFQLLFEWSLMSQPALRSSLSLEEILSLAELAKTYEIRALQNQTVSRIQENGSGRTNGNFLPTFCGGCGSTQERTAPVRWDF